MREIVTAAIFALLVADASAEELRLVAFNIERGYASNAELPTVAQIMTDVGPADVWSLSEVSSSDQASLIAELGTSYDGVLGTRGDDFLLVLFNKDKLEKVASGEIFLTTLSEGQRKPLWIQLRSKATGVEFFVVANHLIRGESDDPRRLGEAKDLNEWAKTHRPAVALGDFNFDFDIDYTDEEIAEGKIQQSQAFAAMLKEDVWAWVRPDRLLKTQCDPDFDSVLDFAFVAGTAKQWERESRIIDIGCDDTAARPDHLPIELVIEVR